MCLLSGFHRWPLAAVLSEDNQSLLRLIRDRRPKSMTELAELTGRQVPSLSHTLRMMEGYGLVELTKTCAKLNRSRWQPVSRS